MALEHATLVKSINGYVGVGSPTHSHYKSIQFVTNVQNHIFKYAPQKSDFQECTAMQSIIIDSSALPSSVFSSEIQHPARTRITGRNRKGNRTFTRPDAFSREAQLKLCDPATRGEEKEQ